MVYDTIIIGSGPAGYTAAIYASRGSLKTLLVDGLQIGGQLIMTTTIENFPGWPEGVLGIELMNKMRQQAERFGTEIKSGEVKEIDFKARPFKVKTGDSEFEGKTIIIATGASARWLGLPEEKRLRNGGVSACATCDGFFTKGKEVAVIGGGDTAMEEANFLTRFADKVTVIHRREELRASKIMVDRAKSNPKIEFLPNYEVIEILGDKKVEGLRLKNTKTGELKEFKCAAVFLAIGHQPNVGFLNGKIELDERGYIKTESNSTQTNIPGVFAAGDVADSRYRQAIIAAGRGCMAAKEAGWYLEDGENKK
ncbi:MAG: thioredoxin-disulfide reductase [Patescibacteria group bacterium]|nr:thioredoxin-disulfide reductase [Patescibacteria group bacterium]MDD5491015.1 thioredoxin-disulfide reductase [Patescibacteria group bacterium]